MDRRMQDKNDPAPERNAETDPIAVELAESEQVDATDVGTETYPSSEAEAMSEMDVSYDMPRKPQKGTKKIICAVTGKEVPKKRALPLYSLRPSLADRIRVDFPDIPTNAPISIDAVGHYRTKVVEEMMLHDRGELTELDRQVAESMSDHETIAENIEEEFEEKRSFADILSDHMAEFGGSWAFLISFAMILVVWIGINLYMGDKEAFDAYPFILLNLVLSCIAAIQAPIIMMSQKRQEQKDRLRSLNDYKVNLKAELEIRHLHEKIDYLLSRQWQRLAEIQQLQMEQFQQKRLKKVKSIVVDTGESNDA
jgi:uncharacterized membrane protein